MPIYEFRCNDTGKRFEVRFKSIAEYDPASVTSPFTGSANVSRLIRKVAIKKASVLNTFTNDESMSALEHADGATLGRALREMAEETGEDMGGEFSHIVDRLEAGQSPEEIEASLPDGIASDALPD